MGCFSPKLRGLGASLAVFLFLSLSLFFFLRLVKFTSLCLLLRDRTELAEALLPPPCVFGKVGAR